MVILNVYTKTDLAGATDPVGREVLQKLYLVLKFNTQFTFKTGHVPVFVSVILSLSSALSAAKSFLIHFRAVVGFSERFLFATNICFWNPDELDFVHLLNAQGRVKMGRKKCMPKTCEICCTGSNPLSLVSNCKT